MLPIYLRAVAALLVLTPLVVARTPHHDEAAVKPKDPADRFTTSRPAPLVLPLPEERDAFFFAVFGDRTGGPAEGIHVLEQAVHDVNLLRPDLVMTVGDLVQGYNETPRWLEQAREYKDVMARLLCPWFPVVGNHDLYWRGKGPKPAGEHEREYETQFGPLWYAFEHKKHWFIALDSDEGDPATGEMDFSKPSCQRMSAEQFAWLGATLERARGATGVFLFLHHPRWLHGGYGDDWDRVHDLLKKAGNVRAVFAGHIHRLRYDGNKDGIEYFTLATVGGDQAGYAPAAGYLHQFHVVTVRKESLAVASLPLGSVQDARAITGLVSNEIEQLVQGLQPRVRGLVKFARDGACDGTVEIEVRNPTTRSIEVTLAPESRDSRWWFTPDHAHHTIPAKGTHTFAVRVARPAKALDSAFRTCLARVDVDYLGEGLRVPIPTRAWDLPLERPALPEPAVPERESWLTLDGVDDCVRVAHEDLTLADGPFTIEGWLCAERFGARVGFLNKTENAEFGLFVNEGQPEFLVNLDGKYVAAKAPNPVLQAKRWHHLAGVFDGSEVRLYVDGRKVAATPGSGKRRMNTLPLMVGADVTKEGGATSFLHAAIDDVRVSQIARYSTDSFTPTRRARVDDATSLLLHMDAIVGPWCFDASASQAHPRVLGEPALMKELSPNQTK